MTSQGPTVEQQTEMARHAGRTLASLLPEQVHLFFIPTINTHSIVVNYVFFSERRNYLCSC